MEDIQQQQHTNNIINVMEDIMHMSRFDYLFRKMMNMDGWLTYGMFGELHDYLQCEHKHVNIVFSLVKNGYTKKEVQDYIHTTLGKTTKDLDAEHALR